MKYWETKSYQIFSWILVLAYMLLIFHFSSQTSAPLPSDFPNIDKVLHFHEYLLLGFLLAHAIPGTHTRKRFWLAFLIAILYGATDEIHQYFVPPRECDVLDWLADASGAWAGAWIYLKAETIWRKL